MERQQGHSLEEIRPDHRYRYEFAARLAKGRVLDAACGIGYGSKILHDAGCRVVGVDICEEAIKTANEHYAGPGYICADLISGPWAGHFDYAISFETTEHLAHPQTALMMFRRDADNLICSVPNENVFKFDPEIFKNDVYPHLRHYTPDEFEQALTVEGWEVVSRHTQLTKFSDVTDGTDGRFLVYVCR